MRWFGLLAISATSLMAQGGPPITSTSFSNNTFVLDWDRSVEGDAALIRVFDVERRSSLTTGSWSRIAADNIVGSHADKAPPEHNGFYRLKESLFPLALIGPDAESTSQGVRIESPGHADALFLHPIEAQFGEPMETSPLSVWVDGIHRATIFYAPRLEGLPFRYGVSGGVPSDILIFGSEDIHLTTPEFRNAKAAAETGAQIARTELTSLLRTFPDSATVWQNIGGTGTNEATVVYYRAKSDSPSFGASPAQFGSQITLLAKPLVSGAAAVPLPAIGDTLPFPGTNLVNLNATNPVAPEPWIGARNSAANDLPVTAARWIYVGTNGSTTNPANPPVARFAYWIEDESFKVDPYTVPAGALDTNTMTPAEIRFLTTTNSRGLDLSRGGFKRFNINSITNGIGGPLDTNNIRIALDRVIAAITNTNAAPLFGQRFYRLSTNTEGINATNAVAAHHASIYLQKVAANMLDYIDSDDQPTIVNNDTNFTIRAGRPEIGIKSVTGSSYGSNSAAAMGIEAVPRLQEYAIHGRIRQMNPIGYNASSAPTNPVAQYEVSIDHYLEFWNPSTRDITLTNAFLKIYDQPGFGTNITGDLLNEGRPAEIPVNNVTFPAGRVTVLTTAPTNEINQPLVGTNLPNIVSLPTPDNARIFSGQTQDLSTNSYMGFNRLFHVSLRPRSSSITDHNTSMLLGNDIGILESFTGLPITVSGGSVPALHFVVNNAAILTNSDLYFVRGGSIRGNSGLPSPSSAEGDARALNEQLEFYLYQPTGAVEQTRFYASGLANGAVPAQSTIGAPNWNFILPTNWVDFTGTNSGASYAPLVVQNAPMQSIGELGHLTDPARVPGTSGALSNVVYSRGGGRTLRIGQGELPAWHDGNQTNASRTWTSWRLADIFSTQTNLSIVAPINPNGALRDGGRALASFVHGFTLLSPTEGAPNTALRSLETATFTAGFVQRLTNPSTSGTPLGALNAFWERGEISELAFFNQGTSVVDGANMSYTLDRGREEIVRRTIQRITTRGSAFTAYVIGQALDGTNVVRTVRIKETFQIQPQFASSSALNDSFDPSDALQTADRFTPATNYTSEILATELTDENTP